MELTLALALTLAHFIDLGLWLRLTHCLTLLCFLFPNEVILEAAPAPAGSLSLTLTLHLFMSIGLSFSAGPVVA